VPVLAPNCKQHILSPAKVRKVCYSLAELYVTSVYFNLIGWRGREFIKPFKGAQVIKFWDVWDKTSFLVTNLLDQVTFRLSIYILHEPGSSVSIVSGYGLDDRAIGVRSPTEAERIFL
jgi:hypothetical protein